MPLGFCGGKMEYFDMIINNCDNCIHKNVCMDYSDMEKIIREFREKSNAHNRSCGSVDDNIVVNWTMKCWSYKSETENIIPNPHLTMDQKVVEKGALEDGFDKAGEVIKTVCDAASKTAYQQLMEHSYNTYKRSRFSCPPDENDRFDISCGENCPH